MVLTRRQTREQKAETHSSEEDSEEEIVVQTSRSAKQPPRRSARLVPKENPGRPARDSIFFQPVQPKKKAISNVRKRNSDIQPLTEREAREETKKGHETAEDESDVEESHSILSRNIENAHQTVELWHMTGYGSRSSSSNSSSESSDDKDDSDDDSERDADEIEENEESKHARDAIAPNAPLKMPSGEPAVDTERELQSASVGLLKQEDFEEEEEVSDVGQVENKTDESEGEITDDISDVVTDDDAESEIDSIVGGMNKMAIMESSEDMDTVNLDSSETVGDSEASSTVDVSEVSASDSERTVRFDLDDDTTATDASEVEMIDIRDLTTDDDEIIDAGVCDEAQDALDVSTIGASSDTYSSDSYDSDSYSDSDSQSESGGDGEGSERTSGTRSDGSSEKSGDSPRTRARKRSRKFPSLSGTFNFDDYNPNTREVDPGFEMPEDLTKPPPLKPLSETSPETPQEDVDALRPKRRLTWSDPLEYIREISPRIRRIFGT